MILKKCLILANGKPPEKKDVNYLRKKGYNFLICADGGANSAKKLNLIPDAIIGDFDSVDPAVLKQFSSSAYIKKLTRQNDTDVEKCIKYALTKKFNDIILLGVTGDRLDHTFCNLGIVLKFYKQIKLKIAAENSLLIPYSGKVKIKTIPDETISIYGFNERTKITSSGLKYKLNSIALPFGKKESTSNRALGEEVILNISGGVIFIIRDLNILKQHDLV